MQFFTIIDLERVYYDNENRFIEVAKNELLQNGIKDNNIINNYSQDICMIAYYHFEKIITDKKFQKPDERSDANLRAFFTLCIGYKSRDFIKELEKTMLLSLDICKDKG